MKTLRLGSQGEQVKFLQKLLHLYEDGIFGNETLNAVRLFQKENGLSVDGVSGKQTWTSLLYSYFSEEYEERVFANYEKVAHYLLTKNNNPRKIKEIILHCSATEEGKDFRADDVKDWHLKRGFSDIGYHVIIDINGHIEYGRDIKIAGAHCTGHNQNSIGICYIGGLKDGKPKDTRTEEQKNSISAVVDYLLGVYDLPKSAVHGHNEFSSKACPCFDVSKEFSYV